MDKKPVSELNKILNSLANSDTVREKEQLNQELLEQIDASIYSEAIEDLKQQIANLTDNLSDGNEIHTIPVLVLETMPLVDLEFLVDHLEKQMMELSELTDKEKQELILQQNIVEDLSAKLVEEEEEKNNLNNSDRKDREKKLAEARENVMLLEKTLSRQNRKQRKLQQLLNQHRKILNRRKSIFELKSFDSLNIDPVLSSTTLEHNQKLASLIKEKLAQAKSPKTENKTEKLSESSSFNNDLFNNDYSLNDDSESEENKSQGKKWLLASLGLGLLIIIGSLLYWFKLTPQQSSSSSEIVSQPIQPEGVGAIGYIEPKGETINVSISSSLEGLKVDQLLVKLGDKVKARQTIAILDSYDRLQAALQQAQSEVELAQAKLEQVKAGAKLGQVQAQDAEFQRTKAELNGQIASQQAIIEELEARLEGEKKSQQATITRIKAELDFARKQCQRFQSLFENGAVSQQQVEEVCLRNDTNIENLREAESQLRQTINTLNAQITREKATLNRVINTLEQQVEAEKATLTAIAEVRPVDVQVAEAELDKAKSAVIQAQAELNLAYVKAPQDGQILEIHTKPGESVSSEGIVDLGYTEQMYVVAQVYETDINRVRLGQTAIIKSDGILPDLTGVVDEIGLKIGQQDVLGTDPVADADARVVEVKIRLSPEDSPKVAGLTNLQVTVIIKPSNS